MLGFGCEMLSDLFDFVFSFSHMFSGEYVNLHSGLKKRTGMKKVEEDRRRLDLEEATEDPG